MKQHMRTSSSLCYHYSELFTWMAALLLKYYGSAAITGIAQSIMNVALLTEWNQQLKDQLNQHNYS